MWHFRHLVNIGNLDGLKGGQDGATIQAGKNVALIGETQ